MTFLWNAKAETATTIIMWLGSLFAVLIAAIWIGKNMIPTHLEVQAMNDDLEGLQNEISSACNSYLFNHSFNPKTEHGIIKFDASKICINNTRELICKNTICDMQLAIEFNLKNITFIVIQKENDTIRISSS